MERKPKLRFKLVWANSQFFSLIPRIALILGMTSLFFLSLLSPSGTQAASISYVGIGIRVQESRNRFQIIGFFEGSSARLAGARLGDQITEIDGESVQGLRLNELSERVRGPVGTYVVLTLVGPDRTSPPRPIRVERIEVRIECLLEGNINLRVNGDPTIGGGWLQGYIGSEYISWNMTNTSLYGTHRGRPINLYVREDSWDQSYSIQGYILNTLITWSAPRGWITGYQDCVY